MTADWGKDATEVGGYNGTHSACAEFAHAAPMVASPKIAAAEANVVARTEAAATPM